MHCFRCLLIYVRLSAMSLFVAETFCKLQGTFCFGVFVFLFVEVVQPANGVPKFFAAIRTRIPLRRALETGTSHGTVLQLARVP
jgi:hypothetical protein